MILGMDGRGLLLKDPAAVSGVHRYCRTLVEGLAERAEVESIRLLVPIFTGAGRFHLPDFDSPKIRRRRWRLPDPLIRLLAHRRRMLSAESVLGPVDIHHTPHLYFGVRPRRGKWVVTIHDLTLWQHPERGDAQAAELHRALLPFFAEHADGILADGRFVARELEAELGVPQDRIRVAHPSVEGFHPVAPDRGRLAREFGIDGPYLLYFGHLLPHKNVVVLAQAFARLDAALKRDLCLVLAGGPERFIPSLRESAAHLGVEGRLLTPGRIPSLASSDLLLHLLSGAAAFVYPSLSEGFGYPPLEAMACGTPVICSDRTCLPEVVGDGARLVDPESPDAIAEAVTGLLASPEEARALARKGLERTALFTRQRFIDRVIEGYRRFRQ